MIYQAAGSHFSGFHEFLHQNPTSPLPPGSIASEPKQLFHKRHISIPSSQRQKRFFWTRQEFPLSATDRVARQPASSTRKQIMASNNEVFVCSCGEELKTKDDVDRHEIHKNWKRGHDKELKCQFPDCETISPQTSNAKRHWRSKHVPARLGHYFCPKCGVGYAKPEDMTRHRAAPDCRSKHRKRCRRTFERDAAPSSLPAVCQTAVPFIDLEADESFPPHSEGTINDVGPPSASPASPHPAESDHIRRESQPSLSQRAVHPHQGSFTIDTSRNIYRPHDQQDPIMLPSHRQDMALTVEVSGVWESLANFYHDATRVTPSGSTPQPNLEMVVSYMMSGQREMLDSMFITHAESLMDGLSGYWSDWSINLEWSDHQITGRWKCVGRTPIHEGTFGLKRICVTGEKLRGAVVYYSMLRGSGEDPALTVPSITSRNDMSSLGGHAAEPEVSSQTPSNDVSPLSTTTAPSSTTGWMDHPYRWPTPHHNLVNERSRTANITGSVQPPLRLRSLLTHGSPLASASPRVSTHDGIRQQQNEGTAHAEEGQHRSQRESISPKAALLKDTATDRWPSFPDTHYKQYSSGTEQFFANFSGRKDTSFVGDSSTSQLSMTGFPRDIEKSRPHLSMQGNASSLEPTGERTTHSTPTSLGSGSSTATPDDQLQSTSPRHTGPDLSHDYAPPHSQNPEKCFVIAGTQELSILGLRMERAGRTRPGLRITLEGGFWASIESLLNDFPKDVSWPDSFNPVWIGPDWVCLWNAMVATMTARPPRMLAAMWNEHHSWYSTIVSIWCIDFKWTEEGIVVFWKLERRSSGPAKTENSVTVDERIR
jgi:hypothetical protein